LPVHRAALRGRGRGGRAGGAVAQARAADPLALARRSVSHLGAGAIKVFRDGDGFVGLENGIYRDAAGASRSAILLLASTDGFAWTQVDPEPIIGPEGSGWKHAFVYQLDVARSGRSYASTTTPGAAGSSAPRGSAWRSRRRSPAGRSRSAPAIGPHRVGRGYAQRVLVRDPTLDSKPS
jgi:hypothetical protein